MDCHKTYEIKLDEDLSKKYENAYQFCGGDTKKFYLILQKCVQPLCIKEVLPMSGWLCNRLTSAFVFSGPVPSTIIILYGWSEICGQRIF